MAITVLSAASVLKCTWGGKNVKKHELDLNNDANKNENLQLPSLEVDGNCVFFLKQGAIFHFPSKHYLCEVCACARESVCPTPVLESSNVAMH
jgi:hypothetical protein